jgi:hypothetical protein
MQVIGNAECQVWLNERRGGDITRIRFGRHELLATFDWKSPVPADESRSYGDPRMDWLSEYRGGWQLLVPNAGGACVVEGVPLPFHGEWSRTHAEIIRHDADHVVMAAGTRLPLTVEREVRVSSNPVRITVRTTVRNESPVTVPFIWGEHPAFPVVGGDTIDFPPAKVHAVDGRHIGEWPMLHDGGSLQMIDDSQPLESVHYLTEFTAGWAALRRSDYGIAMAWDIDDFPSAWLWHEIRSPGFPFFERTSLVAIEPASSWPGTGLADAIARGQAFRLGPGESRSTTVALVPFIPDGRPVVSVAIDGTVQFGPAR